MKLEHVINTEHGLQQDEWSLSQPCFGSEGQITVVGWSGKDKCDRGHKYYILRCSRCSQDTELFGEGYFKSLKSNIFKGALPCGCARHPQWSKDQYNVLCSRKAKEIGYTFICFVGEWKGKNTKIKMLCEKHGEWSTGCVHNLISTGNGCPGCGHNTTTAAASESNTKPDSVMIDSFFDSKAFHPDTKFWRSERKDNQGAKRYWYMSCPECGEIGESFSSSLQKGQRPCACSKHRQQECYINQVIDDRGTVIAVKFGIANNSNQRIKRQNWKSVYTIKQHSVYTFPDVASCKKAERDCKQELETGIMLKRDMSDGYTETTWPQNLDKVIEIYKRNGGESETKCNET